MEENKKPALLSSLSDLYAKAFSVFSNESWCSSITIGKYLAAKIGKPEMMLQIVNCTD